LLMVIRCGGNQSPVLQNVDEYHGQRKAKTYHRP
jgi:hypothetical protein